MPSNVTVIAPTASLMVNQFDDVFKKIKVCSYARVSTKDEEQLTSYESQKEYYTQYIHSNPRWIFAGVYADRGKSGTRVKNRTEFNQMINDCYAGKIDLILTKSVSRFARNTLDTISITRELRRHGIGVIFENDKIDSRDPSSEINLTIRASIAQEESRSTSANVAKGKRMKFEKGEFSFNYKHFLGFTRDKITKCYLIIKEEADVVVLIYEMFLYEGKSCSYIANYLNEQGIPTPSGKKNAKWTKVVIESILTNEKYMGDAILQKTYVKNFLDHKSVKNDRVLPKFHYENVLPVIIPKEMWYQTQAEMDRRKKIGAKYSSTSVFSSKLVCADCGDYYGKKLMHSQDKYRKSYYRCNGMYDNEEKCETPSLTEEQIQNKFIRAYNILQGNLPYVLEETNLTIDTLVKSLDQLRINIDSYVGELKDLTQKTRSLLNRFCYRLDEDDEGRAQYEIYNARFNELKNKLDEEENVKYVNSCLVHRLKGFLKNLDELPKELTEWNRKAWMLLVEEGMVHRDGKITFRFYNGQEITC